MEQLHSSRVKDREDSAGWVGETLQRHQKRRTKITCSEVMVTDRPTDRGLRETVPFYGMACNLNQQKYKHRKAEQAVAAATKYRNRGHSPSSKNAQVASFIRLTWNFVFTRLNCLERFKTLYSVSASSLFLPCLCIQWALQYKERHLAGTITVTMTCQQGNLWCALC